MKEFLKTAIVGGVLFLLPVSLVLLVLNHAMRIPTKPPGYNGIMPPGLPE
jgi:hypothetical protein